MTETFSETTRQLGPAPWRWSAQRQLAAQVVVQRVVQGLVELLRHRCGERPALNVVVVQLLVHEDLMFGEHLLHPLLVDDCRQALPCPLPVVWG